MEKMLTPKDVADRMQISLQAARARMMEMPGCIDISSGGKNKILRVPESGLDDWKSNRTVVIPRASLKLERRPIGRQRTGE